MKNNKKEIITWSIIIVLVVIGIIGYQHRLNALENSEIVKGKIVQFTRSHGRSISRPQIVCRLTIGGESRLVNYDKNDLIVSIGDCVMVRYSISNPRITELLYDKGAVPCE